MTLRHILNMSSGIFWSEGYEASPLKFDFLDPEKLVIEGVADKT